MKSIVRIAIAVGVLAVPGLARAENVVCRSTTDTVKAVTIAEDYFPVTTRFQLDTPNLQPLLETSYFGHRNGAELRAGVPSARW